MEINRRLDITNMDELRKTVPDVKIHGNPGDWRVLCKASSEKQGWMKSTKVMQMHNGCLVQVSTEFRDGLGEVIACAEALTFVPNSKIYEDDEEVPHGCCSTPT